MCKSFGSVTDMFRHANKGKIENGDVCVVHTIDGAGDWSAIKNRIMPGNRKPTKRNVLAISRAMESGGFEPAGSNFVMSTKGEIIDGGHRTEAGLATGFRGGPFVFVALSGKRLDRAKLVLDDAVRPRTEAQAEKMLGGKKFINGIGAAAKLEVQGLRFPCAEDVDGVSGYNRPVRNEIFRRAECRLFSSSYGATGVLVYKKLNGLILPCSLGLRAAYLRSLRIDPDAAVEFFSVMVSCSSETSNDPNLHKHSTETLREVSCFVSRYEAHCKEANERPVYNHIQHVVARVAAFEFDRFVRGVDPFTISSNLDTTVVDKISRVIMGSYLPVGGKKGRNPGRKVVGWGSSANLPTCPGDTLAFEEVGDIKGARWDK